MPTLAATIAPPAGRHPGAALRLAVLLSLLALVAAAPSASAIPSVDDPNPSLPVRVSLWIDGVGGASASQTPTGWQVCWSFSSEPSRVRVEPQPGGGGVLVYFPFVGPLATLNEEIDPIPEEEPFHKTPAAADQTVSLGTQEAGASKYC